jgi:hypothetical protein
LLEFPAYAVTMFGIRVFGRKLMLCVSMLVTGGCLIATIFINSEGKCFILFKFSFVF